MNPGRISIKAQTAPFQKNALSLSKKTFLYQMRTRITLPFRQHFTRLF